MPSDDKGELKNDFNNTVKEQVKSKTNYLSKILKSNSCLSFCSQIP